MFLLYGLSFNLMNKNKKYDAPIHYVRIGAS